MIKTVAVLASLAGGLAGATCAVAAPMESSMPMAAPDFVTAAAQSDMFEIEEGRMAQKMGSPAIRRFGATMVRDHMKTTATLKRAIKKAGMDVPPPPPLRPDQEQMMSTLQSTSGPDFDKMYLMQQVQSHQEALALQSGYAKGGDTAALKAAARGAVPIVKMHLKMAETMSGM